MIPFPGRRGMQRLRLPFLPVLLLLVAGLLTAPQLGGLVRAEDEREELGRVIKTIPPNGPFWQYGNVVMSRRSRKAGMASVVFPHWKHRALYTCRVCHMELGFAMRKGDTGITRSDYTQGKYCGACHDGKTAFNVQGKAGDPVCDYCHMKSTQGLQQRFEKFAEALPIAPFGNGIDWAEAYRNELVVPRNALKEKPNALHLPDKLKTPLRLSSAAPRSDVLFSHEDHFAELDCSSCHPDVFNIKRKGTQSFSMQNNLFGNFCGVCHMLVSFPMNDCKRCHPTISSTGG